MSNSSETIETLELLKINQVFKSIAMKVIHGKRISPKEGLQLFHCNDLGFLGLLANFVRYRINGDNAFFNHNFHIEPTNICIYRCKFCSYSRKISEDGAWECDLEEISRIAEKYINKNVTEVHIVGGVHPRYNLEYYAEMVRRVRTLLPQIHIKAFSAVELDVMFKPTGYLDGFKILKQAGLDSIPGGGAEIFDETIREEICPDKVSSENWLKIHETAHSIGIVSNATMLYGHIEKYQHRIEHMNRLRDLQDKTNGFQCFIPLKYRKANNPMSEIGEVSIVEDLKNYAISRIFLDNIQHLKAYWPAIGKEMAQLSLNFGVDDIDGTIDDSTKIYTMAGAEEQKPVMTTNELISLIQQVGRNAVERDSWYKPVKEY